MPKRRTTATARTGKGSRAKSSAADTKRSAGSTLSRGAMTKGQDASRTAYVTVRQVGGSAMCAIPKVIQDAWGEVRPRTTLLCRVEGERLVFERIAKRPLSLKERIAMCDLNAPISDTEREWMEDGSAGEELL